MSSSSFAENSEQDEGNFNQLNSHQKLYRGKKTQHRKLLSSQSMKLNIQPINDTDTPVDIENQSYALNEELSSEKIPKHIIKVSEGSSGQSKIVINNAYQIKSISNQLNTEEAIKMSQHILKNNDQFSPHKNQFIGDQSLLFDIEENEEEKHESSSRSFNSEFYESSKEKQSNAGTPTNANQQQNQKKESGSCSQLLKKNMSLRLQKQIIPNLQDALVQQLGENNSNYRDSQGKIIQMPSILIEDLQSNVNNTQLILDSQSESSQVSQQVDQPFPGDYQSSHQLNQAANIYPEQPKSRMPKNSRKQQYQINEQYNDDQKNTNNQIKIPYSLQKSTLTKDYQHKSQDTQNQVSGANLDQSLSEIESGRNSFQNQQILSTRKQTAKFGTNQANDAYKSNVIQTSQTYNWLAMPNFAKHSRQNSNNSVTSGSKLSNKVRKKPGSHQSSKVLFTPVNLKDIVQIGHTNLGIPNEGSNTLQKTLTISKINSIQGLCSDKQLKVEDNGEDQSKLSSNNSSRSRRNSNIDSSRSILDKSKIFEKYNKSGINNRLEMFDDPKSPNAILQNVDSLKKQESSTNQVASGLSRALNMLGFSKSGIQNIEEIPEVSNDKLVLDDIVENKLDDDSFMDIDNNERPSLEDQIYQSSSNLMSNEDYITSLSQDRLQKRIKRKQWMIYPEDRLKFIWEATMSLILMFTCVMAPYSLAFQESGKGVTSFFIEIFLDVIFFLDVIVNFISAYYDNDFIIVEDHRIIGKNYLQSWFIVDSLSVIPFDLILEFSNFGKLTRFSRVGQLYKIIRFSKMVRLLKLFKDRSKMAKNMTEVLKVGIGFERLIYMLFLYILAQHVIACVWIFTGKFYDDSKDNWIYANGLNDSTNSQLYMTSFYFTVTTIVTVGYGDITATNDAEKLVCIFLMIIGVIAFSFGTGALSSIISNYDSSQAKLKEKMSTLNDINKEYNINTLLFRKLIQTINYDHSKKSRDFTSFMDELPYKLRVELAMEIHKKMYQIVTFFRFKDKSFIAWVGKSLRPINIQEQEYIYKEGEDVTEIYFLVQGIAGFALPRFDNTVYIKIEEGDHFGHSEIILENSYFQNPLSSTNAKILRNQTYDRRFTILALIDCELLTLALDDIEKMRIEFPDIFLELFENSNTLLKKQLEIKYEAMKLCQGNFQNPLRRQGHVIEQDLDQNDGQNEVKLPQFCQESVLDGKKIFSFRQSPGNSISIQNNGPPNIPQDLKQNANFNDSQEKKQLTAPALDFQSRSQFIREYKEKNMKRKLTKQDLKFVSRFAENSISLKQIGEGGCQKKDGECDLDDDQIGKNREQQKPIDLEDFDVFDESQQAASGVHSSGIKLSKFKRAATKVIGVQKLSTNSMKGQLFENNGKSSGLNNHLSIQQKKYDQQESENSSNNEDNQFDSNFMDEQIELKRTDRRNSCKRTSFKLIPQNRKMSSKFQKSDGKTNKNSSQLSFGLSVTKNLRQSAMSDINEQESIAQSSADKQTIIDINDRMAVMEKAIASIADALVKISTKLE